MGAPAIATPPRAPRPAPAGRPKPKPKAGPKPKANGSRPRATAPARRVSQPTRRAQPGKAGKPPPKAVAAPSIRRRSRATPAAGFAMIPVTAVGRTAVAVGGIADCGLVGWMSRSRAWIVVLGVLLGGIVALNVWGLSLSASGSGTVAKVDALQRENSVLRGRVARRLSSSEIEQAAAKLGLAIPAPDAVSYLEAERGAASSAAKRLLGGEIALQAPVPEATESLDPAAVPPDPGTDPAAIAPVGAGDPLTGAPLVADPALALDPAIDPVTGAPVVP